MKNTKIPLSVLKDISDKNYKTLRGYSIDVEAIMNEYPDMTEIEMYEGSVYRGIQKGKKLYQIHFKSLCGGMWMSQIMTTTQMNMLKKQYGASFENKWQEA